MNEGATVIRASTRTPKKFSSIAASLCTTLLVSACAPSTTEPADSTDTDTTWLSEYDLSGLDARAVIEHLDALPVAERPGELMASVQPEAVQLSDADGNQASLSLPADEFYVSVAPYVDQTHDCFFHSLTTCLGELSNEEIDVTVTDRSNDSVIIDDTVRTYDNGFTGFWLPRGIDATLTIEHDGRTASTPVSTTEDDPTCLTTLQLAKP